MKNKKIFLGLFSFVFAIISIFSFNNTKIVAYANNNNISSHPFFNDLRPVSDARIETVEYLGQLYIRYAFSVPSPYTLDNIDNYDGSTVDFVLGVFLNDFIVPEPEYFDAAINSYNPDTGKPGRQIQFNQHNQTGRMLYKNGFELIPLSINPFQFYRPGESWITKDVIDITLGLYSYDELDNITTSDIRRSFRYSIFEGDIPLLLQEVSNFSGGGDNWQDGYNAGYNDASQKYYDDGYNQGYQDGINTGGGQGGTGSYDDGFNAGYNKGYDAGLAGAGDSYSQGYNKGYTDANLLNDEALENGKIIGFNNGYQKGYQDAIGSGGDSLGYGWLMGIFNVMGSLLSIEILPNITIGFIVGIPIVLALLFFILRLAKGGE